MHLDHDMYIHSHVSQRNRVYFTICYRPHPASTPRPSISGTSKPILPFPSPVVTGSNQNPIQSFVMDYRITSLITETSVDGSCSDSSCLAISSDYLYNWNSKTWGLDLYTICILEELILYSKPWCLIWILLHLFSWLRPSQQLDHGFIPISIQTNSISLFLVASRMHGYYSICCSPPSVYFLAQLIHWCRITVGIARISHKLQHWQDLQLWPNPHEVDITFSFDNW